MVQGGTGGQRKKIIYYSIFLFSIPNNNNGTSSGLIFGFLDFWPGLLEGLSACPALSPPGLPSSPPCTFLSYMAGTDRPKSAGPGWRSRPGQYTLWIIQARTAETYPRSEIQLSYFILKNFNIFPYSKCFDTLATYKLGMV